MKTLLLIFASGMLVAGAAFLAAMAIWAWHWFRKREEVPSNFRTVLQYGNERRTFERL